MLAFADFSVAVTNARATASWWQEKLGFAVHTVGEPEGHAVVVAPPGERFLLHLCEGFEPVAPGNTGIAFVTDEIEPMVRRMEAAGVLFPEPVRIEPWGGSAKFADPDGNVFWLVGAPASFVRRETARRAPTARRRSRTRPSAPSRSARTSPPARTARARRRPRSRRGRKSR